MATHALYFRFLLYAGWTTAIRFWLVFPKSVSSVSSQCRNPAARLISGARRHDRNVINGCRFRKGSGSRCGSAFTIAHHYLVDLCYIQSLSLTSGTSEHSTYDWHRLEYCQLYTLKLKLWHRIGFIAYLIAKTNNISESTTSQIMD